MESKRQQKFARLIQKDLSEILQRDLTALTENAFVTITTVKISPDLGSTKIYCSIMMHPNRDALIRSLNENKSQIRNALGRKIKNQVRIVPDLFFYLDTTGEDAASMDNIISNLDIPEEE